MGFIQNQLPFIRNMDNETDKGIGQLKITENGKYDSCKEAFTRVDVRVAGEAPSPKPTSVEKGDIIFFGGHSWRVLKAGNNGALDDVEVTRIGFESSKYCQNSPSQSGQTVDFTCGAETKTGIKYAGSDLDTFCNTTFYNSLPEDVQGAIIEQEVVQDMYDTSSSVTEDNAEIVFNSSDITYRIRKVSTEAVTVGTRKIYSLDCKHVYDYLGYSGTKLTLTNWELNKMVFNAQGAVGAFAWLSSANSSYFDSACNVSGGLGGVRNTGYSSTYIVCPTFHINLSGIDFTK